MAMETPACHAINFFKAYGEMRQIDQHRNEMKVEIYWVPVCSIYLNKSGSRLGGMQIQVNVLIGGITDNYWQFNVNYNSRIGFNEFLIIWFFTLSFFVVETIIKVFM